MPLIDPRHIRFVLDDVLRVEDVLALPVFSQHDRAAVEQILETAEKLAVAEFLPSFAHLDANEPRMENGRVVLPPEIEQALTTFRDAGFYGMTADAEHGGFGLPRTAANAAFLWFQAANVSIANYALLTMSAAELLAQHASAEQKSRYLAPMLEGRFLGTMALSEPQAGSSLGDITTAARLRPDGTYALKGTKMWISGGEHDMAETIVHLMLARIDGAPKGVRGISLFIVPRKRLDRDGKPTVWNNVALAGLNHKMGQRGTVNTVLNVGEGGETIGEIVGKPGQGLAAMFTMMNEARICVSMGAVAHASAGYQHSLSYARDRMQGRHADSKDPGSAQVPLIEHADVRRMLLQQKATAEGGAALGLYLAKLADLKKAAATEQERADASLLLDFLTPVFKAWVSEESLTANFNAMQVLGGAGYTRDHPVEQHYRDNRLNPIHEGTNGIQALDLIGRKAVMTEGRALELYLERVRAAARKAGKRTSSPHLPGYGKELERAAIRVADAVSLYKQETGSRGVRVAQATARHVLNLVGTTTFAWIWLEQAIAASERLQRQGTEGADRAFLEGIIQTCRFVFLNRMPEARMLADMLAARDDGVFDMRDEWFGR